MNCLVYMQPSKLCPVCGQLCVFSQDKFVQPVGVDGRTDHARVGHDSTLFNVLQYQWVV